MIKKDSEILKDDEIKVILVDRTDQPSGTEDKLSAHEHGHLHRAFSVILYNSEGEMLIQRRALSKYHSPGLWANTCCGHPLPHESAKEAAQRRLREEIGFTCDLNFRTCILYFLRLEHQMIEHEYVHVFEAEVPSDTLFKLNSDEVNAIKWMLPHQARKEAKQKPPLYTRWLRLYLLKYFAKVFKQKLA